MEQPTRQQKTDDFVRALSAAYNRARCSNLAELRRAMQKVAEDRPGSRVPSLSTLNDLFNRRRQKVPGWDVTSTLILAMREIAEQRAVGAGTVGSLETWEKRWTKAKE